jgi:hypothetical protein
MNRQLLSPAARAHENQLEEPGDNLAKRQIRELAELSPAAQLAPPGFYQLYAVRSHATAGKEIFGQKTPVLLGRYDESDLYGPALSTPKVAFKSALVLMKDRAARLALLDPDDPDTAEYGHQAALFWADVAALKGFIGTSPILTEVVAELRTLRFQFLRKDTPPTIFQALAVALGCFVESSHWDTSAVDQFVETLEHAGYDSLIIDSPRVSNA